MAEPNYSPKIVGTFSAVDTLAPEAGSIDRIEVGPDGTSATFAGTNPSKDAGGLTLTGLKQVTLAVSESVDGAGNAFGESGANTPTPAEIVANPAAYGAQLFSAALTPSDAGQPWAITASGLQPGKQYDYCVFWND